MKTKVIIAFLSVLSLASCGGKGDAESTQTVKIDGKYLLEVPTHMTKATGLNDDASLEYQNAIKELYVVVIDEEKAELNRVLEENALSDVYPPTLDGYIKLVTENYRTAFNTANIPVPAAVTINGLPAKTMSFEGHVQGLPDIYYKMAFVEGKNNFYQVMTWTLANRKEKHDAAMQDMVNSFKETDKSKSKG